MYDLKTQDQGVIILSQQDYLPILVESFLIDRKSQGLYPETIDFYTKKLMYFLKYYEGQVLTQISQLTTDLVRRYILELSETHIRGASMPASGPYAVSYIGSKMRRSCCKVGKIRFAV
jgi:hypothetical protein